MFYKKLDVKKREVFKRACRKSSATGVAEVAFGSGCDKMLPFV